MANYLCSKCGRPGADSGTFLNHLDGTAMQLILCPECTMFRHEQDRAWAEKISLAIPLNCQTCGAPGALQGTYLNYSNGHGIKLDLCQNCAQRRVQNDHDWLSTNFLRAYANVWPDVIRVPPPGFTLPAPPEITTLADSSRVYQDAAAPLVNAEWFESKNHKPAPPDQAEEVLKKFVDQGGEIFGEITNALQNARDQKIDFNSALSLLEDCYNFLCRSRFDTSKEEIKRMRDTIADFLNKIHYF